MKKLMQLLLLFTVLCIPMQMRSQTFLKKTLETKTKDGVEFKWYKYSYSEGDKTLYAAFGLNGKRITPNNEHSPYYCGGGMFMCNTEERDNWGSRICVGYNLNGEKVFPESLEATFIYYSGDGFFKLEKKNDYGKEIEAVYNSRGACIIPFSMGYNWIAYYPEHRAFWCSYKDASGQETECHTYSTDALYYAVGEYHSSGEYNKTSFYNLADPSELDRFNKHKKRAPFASASSSAIASSSSSSTSKTNVSSSASLLGSKEHRLLHKGYYGVCGTMGELPSVIEIYTDAIVISSTIGQYHATVENVLKEVRPNGTRVYQTSDDPDGPLLVVDANYNIRRINSLNNCAFSKISSGMPMQQGGNIPFGGVPEYQWQDHGTTTNPVQPHQATKSCPLCHGSGKCETCNGKGWYYGIGGSVVKCPNCNQTGRCSSCGGSGKKTTTTYY